MVRADVSAQLSVGPSAATIAAARCWFLAAKVLCEGATVVGEVGSLVVVAVSVRSVRTSRLSWLHPFSFHGDRGQRARQSHHADFQVHDDRKAPRDRTFTATTSTDQPVPPPTTAEPVTPGGRPPHPCSAPFLRRTDTERRSCTQYIPRGPPIDHSAAAAPGPWRLQARRAH